ncbi:mucin TcMUCII, putative [Trypanosoma cruzi marinkellei]|uniref:Mucin TcMUCII, putative n=1 Tax=Trypanosoma cruzi marinkellei TaxID=85056 RepID=K2MUJ3_TRYCR|nr:mucin TcMUCII, putative [Trypanosoma cruzi marinkellei]
MMTTCRLLCALLVLALCCCPSVCVAESTVNQVSDPDQPPDQKMGVVSGRANTSETSTSTAQVDALKESSETAGRLGGPVPLGVTLQTKGDNDITGSTSLSNEVEQSHSAQGLQPPADASKHNTQERTKETSKSELKEKAQKVRELVQDTETVGPGLSSQSSNGQIQSGKPASQGSSKTADPLEDTNTESPESATERGKGEAGGLGSPGAGAGTPGIPGNDTKQSHITPGLGLTAGPANGNDQESSTASNTSESADLPNTVQDPTPSGATAADQAKDVTDPFKEPDTTTKTTTTNAPTTTTTTTTTTGAPSRLPEIDGSLSSPAWVCAPLLLAVSALAYTTLG